MSEFEKKMEEMGIFPSLPKELSSKEEFDKASRNWEKKGFIKRGPPSRSEIEDVDPEPTPKPAQKRKPYRLPSGDDALHLTYPDGNPIITKDESEAARLILNQMLEGNLTSEEAVDEFLGSLAKGASQALGGVVGGVGDAVGGIAKGVGTIATGLGNTISSGASKVGKFLSSLGSTGGSSVAATASRGSGMSTGTSAGTSGSPTGTIGIGGNSNTPGGGVLKPGTAADIGTGTSLGSITSKPAKPNTIKGPVKAGMSKSDAIGKDAAAQAAFRKGTAPKPSVTTPELSAFRKGTAPGKPELTSI